MREIEFRGKSKISGKWFLGSLIKDKDRRWISVQEKHWNLGVFDNFEVVPETVGQCTGLKDKNGKEIYEGDILKTSIEEGDIITQVVFKEFCWKEKLISSPLNHLREYFPFSGDISIVTEIIGNIYENPELLEESK